MEGRKGLMSGLLQFNLILILICVVAGGVFALVAKRTIFPPEQPALSNLAKSLNNALVAAKIEDELDNLPFKRKVQNSLMVAVPGVCMLSILIFAAGYNRKYNIVEQQLDADTILRIRHKDLPKMIHIANGIMAARQLAAAGNSENMQRSMELNRLLFQAAKAGLTGKNILPEPAMKDVTPIPAHIPSFSELLHSGQIVPGNPLILGFDEAGQPQPRTLREIKAMSVAGWQGSGKTLSTAYLISCILAQYPHAQAYIIDPHKNHDEGLGNLLRPLEKTGRLVIINELDTISLIQELNKHMDRRLRGEEDCVDPILLVIDELSALGKLPIFKKPILPYIERCTEESRKANMAFIGCSPKWNAKHFGNKADIRQSIPSLLLHKCKSSQADFLIEGKEKKLVKKLTGPGQAVLSTSHDNDPSIVQMPLITRDNIRELSELLVSNGPAISVASNVPVNLIDSGNGQHQTVIQLENQPDSGVMLLPGTLKEIIDTTGWSQRKIAEQTGVPQTRISKYVNGDRTKLSHSEQQMIHDLVIQGLSKSDGITQKVKNVNHSNHLNHSLSLVTESDDFLI